MSWDRSPLDAVNVIRKQSGQVVLVLQGGGALGAYQGGVYEALNEARVEPDWIIGTSIGAINASIIAGNAVDMTRIACPWFAPDNALVACDEHRRKRARLPSG